MNTIFKFYNQAWMLYAVVSACALYFFMARQFDSIEDAAAGKTRSQREEQPAAPFSVPPGYPLAEPQTWPALLTPLSTIEGQAPHASSVLTLNPTMLSAREHGLESSKAARPVSPSITSAGQFHPTFVQKLLHPVRRPVLLLNRWPLWGLFLVPLLGSSLIYTYAGTISRETYRTSWLPQGSVPLTLDGMAFMKVAYAADYAGISWLNAHARGAQVMAEADQPDYDWRSRVSMFTGLPDIYNGIHEPEQRYGEQVASRSNVVGTLYNTSHPAQAWQIIRSYGVKYIYVGFSERQCAPHQCFSRAGLAKFDRMVGHGLQLAFRQPGVRIYMVGGA